jgi:hypothetical protein
MTRARLPDRRPLETLEFQLDGHRFTAGIGRDDAGRIAELWLASGKDGGLLGTVMHDTAICASLLLQHGVPLSAIAHSLKRNPDGRAAGPLGRLIDLLADEGGA